MKKYINYILLTSHAIDIINKKYSKFTEDVERSSIAQHMNNTFMRRTFNFS